MPANKQLVGPPEPRSKYDNLPVEPEPVEGEGKQSLIKALLPLMLAQGMDILSTEAPTGFLAYPNTRETNPLPGMGSTAGRIGWGALETALMGVLMKKKPKLGKVARNSAVGAHSALVLGNEALKRQRQGVGSSRSSIVEGMMAPDRKRR